MVSSAQLGLGVRVEGKGGGGGGRREEGGGGRREGRVIIVCHVKIIKI